VLTTDGKRYLLRYSEQEDAWTLQSGFDGDELLARPGEVICRVPLRWRRNWDLS